MKAGFDTSDVSQDRQVSGTRRTLVEEFYASIGWENVEDIRKFLKVIEYALILSFVDEDQKEWLRQLCTRCGFEVDQNGYTIYYTSRGIGKPVKNLIFVSIGPKPEIVLSDSVSNDIEIVKNAEYCLVYDLPIKLHGLLWGELVNWWSELTESPSSDYRNSERKLYARLRKSLATNEERLLFRRYFEKFHDSLGNKSPALIPQVYLHYDPYTIKQLHGQKRLTHQRMDFLLLLSDRNRIVIEIDGKQHYSADGIAEPKMYAKMVAEDRLLKLTGYEVYRFGNYELQGESGEALIDEFLHSLFKKYEIEVE
ncbi:MAG: DUF559 domain-containing protein [Ignavibacteria bacterium]|nr:DUF559 domain-containing protein [Ignavibacteria bacterium]